MKNTSKDIAIVPKIPLCTGISIVGELNYKIKNSDKPNHKAKPHQHELVGQFYKKVVRQDQRHTASIKNNPL